MVLNVGSSIISSITNLYDSNMQISDKPMVFDEKTISEYSNWASDTYEEVLSSFTFKPNSLDEFKFSINSMMTLSCGDLSNISDPDYMCKQSAVQNLISSLDYDSEFDKFLESKGCVNEEELQALNQTMFKTTEELRYFSEARLRGHLSNLDRDKVPYAMSMSKELVSGIDIETLAKFLRADNFESGQMAQGFIKDYSGGKLNLNELLAVEKEFNSYMKIVENQEKEAQKHIDPKEQLRKVDYSKYDEKYGEKYETNLALNYEE